MTSTKVGKADPRSILRREPFIRYDRNNWGGRLADHFLRELRIVPHEQFELDSLEALSVMVGPWRIPPPVATGHPRQHTFDPRSTFTSGRAGLAAHQLGLFPKVEIEKLTKRPAPTEALNGLFARGLIFLMPRSTVQEPRWRVLPFPILPSVLERKSKDAADQDARPICDVAPR